MPRGKAKLTNSEREILETMWGVWRIHNCH